MALAAADDTRIAYARRIDDSPILSAEVVLACDDLDPTLAYFTDRLGFRVATIWPADRPRHAVLTGHGLRIALEPRVPGGPGDAPPGVLRLRCTDPDAFGDRVLTAPNGTRVEVVAAERTLAVPPLRSALVVSRPGDEGAYAMGRAGMQYRDLLPGRLGGRFIASHIRIPDGGPVPDYVHFHDVRFQVIFCRRGWVRVVYEDQGPPFVMHAGDCVLQPPRIRHRVLEASAGLEVVELGCPAEHETHADHELDLPTGGLHPERAFGGQRFARHVAAGADWRPWRLAGFEARDTDIDPATDGLAGVRVVRRASTSAAAPTVTTHDGELRFWFVLAGAVVVRSPGGDAIALGPDDAISIPAGWAHALVDVTDDLQLLEVTLPA